MNQATTAEPQPKKQGCLGCLIKFLLLVITCVIAFVILMAVTVGLLWYLANQPDPDWNPPDMANRAVLLDTAETLERTLDAQLNATRAPGESFQVALPANEINAWLATRVIAPDQPDLKLDEFGQTFKQPHLHVTDDGRIKLMTQMNINGRLQYVTIAYKPEQLGDRTILKLDTLRAGQVPLPSSQLAEAVRGLINTLDDDPGQTTEQFNKIMDQFQALDINQAIQELSDDPKTAPIIRKLSIDGQTIRIDCQQPE